MWLFILLCGYFLAFFYKHFYTSWLEMYIGYSIKLITLKN